MSTAVTPESSSAQPVIPTSPLTRAPARGVSKDPNGAAAGGAGPVVVHIANVSVAVPYRTENVVAAGATSTMMLPLVATASTPGTGAIPLPTDVQYVLTPALCSRVMAAAVGCP